MLACGEKSKNRMPFDFKNYDDDFIRRITNPSVADEDYVDDFEDERNANGDSEELPDEEKEFDFTQYNENFAREIMFPVAAAAYSSTPFECLSRALGFKKSKWDYGGRVSFYFDKTFSLVWKGIEDHVYNSINEHPKWDIWISGHSLGGALATLAASFLVQSKYIDDPNKVKLVTFGQPRVGDKEFAEAFDDQDLYVYRVVHWRDLVPGILKPGYQHQGEEVINRVFTNRVPKSRPALN
ncbi:triacylglycerol lipase [Ancylostoma caninum]|uniref:Triacylglycerol lipase n=1 Tax=Ancylostoma caninum TaxID=29170 RepID=A0A368H7K2_ANCCA|nr:triacylglycerol lipase [Ancylostoma caninum]